MSLWSMALRDTLILLLLFGLYFAFMGKSEDNMISSTLSEFGDEEVDDIIDDDWEFETVEGMVSDVKNTVSNITSGLAETFESLVSI